MWRHIGTPSPTPRKQRFVPLSREASDDFGCLAVCPINRPPAVIKTVTNPGTEKGDRSLAPKTSSETGLNQGGKVTSELTPIVGPPRELVSCSRGENDLSHKTWPRLSKGLARGVQVQHAHCEITKSQLLQITTLIRSRLLDFVLQLEEKFPPDASPQEMKTLSEQVRRTMAGNDFGAGRYRDQRGYFHSSFIGLTILERRVT